MNIQRHYHFYAAHRNQLLKDKCRNIHGHQYELTVSFAVQLQENEPVTVLFGDLDKSVEPIVNRLDHGMLIDSNDSLYRTLQSHEKQFNEKFKLNVIDAPTSVENVSLLIFDQVAKELLKLPFADRCSVCEVIVKETKSSAVIVSVTDHLTQSKNISKFNYRHESDC